MDEIQREHDRIDAMVADMVEHPEKLDADAIRQVAGVLLDLNAYARQLNDELTRACCQIALISAQKTSSPVFSMN